MNLWIQGGWTGSLDRLAARQVQKQLRANSVSRRSRYSIGHRLLRLLLNGATFGRLILAYVLFNLAVTGAETLVSWLRPDWIPVWTASGSPPITDIKALLLNVSSYMLGAQVGLLGVISLALALITLIAQRAGASTDVQVYYHESFSFELVATSMALASVLCVQLLWPLQFLAHRLGFGTHLMAFKLILMGAHMLWLLINLFAAANFIATTFRFVQQSTREQLRKQYTANVIWPMDLKQRLREHYYSAGAVDLGDDTATDEKLPVAAFGMDFGSPRESEISSNAPHPLTLYDVRMIWVRWVIRRWLARSQRGNAKGATANHRRHSYSTPFLWFTPRIGVPLKGSTCWCFRRGGVPLTSLERFVLRHSFRFKKAVNEV